MVEIIHEILFLGMEVVGSRIEMRECFTIMIDQHGFF